MNPRRTIVRLLAVGSLVAAAMVAGTSLASADDHLFNAATSNGQRDFANPVTQNPSGTSGAAAQPGTVPGLGDPKVGEDTGTPAFSCEALAERLAARSAGMGPTCG